MSIFTNSSDSAKEQADAYVDAVLELLGDREPLAVLSGLVDEIEAYIKDLGVDELRKPEAPGKWSILEVIQHLADSDLVWAYRTRMILAHDRPSITGYDQDLWARKLRYRQADPRLALQQLEVLRKANLRLLRSLSPEQLQRAGVHEERGEESLEYLVRLYAGHDLVHLRQISRIRKNLS